MRGLFGRWGRSIENDQIIFFLFSATQHNRHRIVTLLENDGKTEDSEEIATTKGQQNKRVRICCICERQSRSQ